MDKISPVHPTLLSNFTTEGSLITLQGDELMQQYLVAMSVFVVGISLFSLVYFRMSVIISKRLHSNVFRVVMGAKTHFFDSNPVGNESFIRLILDCLCWSWMDGFIYTWWLCISNQIMSAADLKDSFFEISHHLSLCPSFSLNVQCFLLGQILNKFARDLGLIDSVIPTLTNTVIEVCLIFIPSNIFFKRRISSLWENSPWLKFFFHAVGFGKTYSKPVFVTDYQ